MTIEILWDHRCSWVSLVTLAREFTFPRTYTQILRDPEKLFATHEH